MLRAIITHAYTACCIAALQADVDDTSSSAVVTSPSRSTTNATTSDSDAASDATAPAAAVVQQAAVTPESVTASGVSTAADIADVEDTAAVHNGKQALLTHCYNIKRCLCQCIFSRYGADQQSTILYSAAT
jgi:hypothetical protein